MKIIKINTILVLGSGVMGHGIAQIFAQHGYSVRLVDTDKAMLDRALDLIKGSLEVLAEEGVIEEKSITGTIGRIEMTTDLEGAAKGIDMVIEAVPEVEDIKKKVYARLNDICDSDVIFATNTSGLDVFSFAGVSNPSRLLATHFFAPAQLIPLVEVCPGPETDPHITNTVVTMLQNMGKEPVVLKGFVPSFIVNRIQNYIAMSVFEILNNGWATPEQIDRAVKASLGVRLPIVGVVQTMDFTGLDLVNDIMKSKGMTMPIIDDKVKDNRLGVKTSRGFYDYKGKSEKEICKTRDQYYLKMIGHLRTIDAFKPI
ncbi:MAG: hypothetical protein CVV44_11255 [Spirochaetae bacterium HGW-Spirochaetae-1]|jgi:3-hydroxyacyl-CoA dehydrogenase|nr:MAG: hypothetical protein CVV44_11255 [Spirochaetae bacterium HGW-Spirochaetae-1]